MNNVSWNSGIDELLGEDPRALNQVIRPQWDLAYDVAHNFSTHALGSQSISGSCG